VSSKFDFEAIYAAYPRKLGRKKGLQRCRSAIRTQAKFDALQAAVKHYTAFVAGKDVEFVKHFDSFMSVWEDWVEPQSPPGNAGRATGTPAKPNRPPVLDGPPRHHGEADEDYKARLQAPGRCGVTAGPSSQPRSRGVGHRRRARARAQVRRGGG
jgi:hypothetical protein